MEKNKTRGFIGGKFLPFHQGHVYSIIVASNYVDKLYVVLSTSKNRDRELCEIDGIKYIPAETRLSWLGESLNNLENIELVHIEDDQWDNNYNWEQGAKMIRKAIGSPIDYVFSSENTYNEHFKKYYPESQHIVINAKRKTVDISATKMRENLYKYWDKLPSCVRSYFVKRVAIVGTESCGKTTLTKKLAKFYNTNYVHEVGRDYCKKYSNKLTKEKFNLIAIEHFLLQSKKATESNKVLFVDSEAVITQYYLDMYFPKENSPLIEEIIKIQNYDLVIYLEPDIEWVSDNLRFAGEKETRMQNNQKLKQRFKKRKIPFVSVSGDYVTRFIKSKGLIDELFKENTLGERNV